MESVDWWDDSQDDSIVNFDDSMQAFVADSIGDAEIVDDGCVVGSVADMDFIVDDTYDREDDGCVVGFVATMDFIVDDTYDREDNGCVVGSAADMDFIVDDTYDREDDGCVVGSAADMDFIVDDTYDREDHTVFEEGPTASRDEGVLGLNVGVLRPVASEEDGILGFHHGLQTSSQQGQTAPKKFLLPDLNLPSAEDVLQNTTLKADRDFDLNKLPIRGMLDCKDDPFYKESFILMLRILIPGFY